MRVRYRSCDLTSSTFRALRYHQLSPLANSGRTLILAAVRMSLCQSWRTSKRNSVFPGGPATRATLVVNVHSGTVLSRHSLKYIEMAGLKVRSAGRQDGH